MKYFNLCIIFCSLGVFGAEYKPKDFSYLIEKNPGFDKKIFETHFQLYRGYVNQVNDLNRRLSEEMAKGDKDALTVQSIKRRLGWEYDGMCLHELYFENLGGNGQLASDAPLYKKIAQKFSSFALWKEEIMTISQTRGIGWIVLYWDPEKDVLTNAWVEEHSTGPLISNVPLLVIDLWEHAYLCQFGLNRAQYMNAVFSSLNWDVIHRRMNSNQ